MARLKKWNNQGGSKREYKLSGDYESTTNIPAFDKLPESKSTSFVFSEKTKQESADYGEFGDDVWTGWKPYSNLELPEYTTSDYTYTKPSSLEVDDDLEESTKIKTVRVNKTTEYKSYIKSKDPELVPEAVYQEYEIIVKFKKLILTILSGQAYACRNNINNALFDFSLVIRSSEPISINGGEIGTLYTIQSSGSKQDPMFAVYNWVLEKLKLVTDNTGKLPDPTLRRLTRKGVTPLPATSLIWDGQEWNLFNGSGKEPTQICLHATNDVVKFRPTSPKNANFLWTVLSAGEPLSLCKSLDVPKVSLFINPLEIDPTTGSRFNGSIYADGVVSSDVSIKFEIAGDVPESFYIISGSSTNTAGDPILIIPTGSDFVEFSIEPLVDAAQIANRSMIVSLLEDLDAYEIEPGYETVNLVVIDPVEILPLFVITTDFNIDPRQLTYDIDFNITAIGGLFSPAIDSIIDQITVEINSGDNNYWRITGFNLSSFTFYSIDNSGTSTQYIVPASQKPADLRDYFYIGKGNWICDHTTNTIESAFSGRLPIMRIWNPDDGMTTGYNAGRTTPLMQPDAADLDGFASPSPSTHVFKRAYLSTDYYLDKRQDPVSYSNSNVTVNYENAGIGSNAFLPLVLGERSLYVKVETPAIPVLNVGVVNGASGKGTSYNLAQNTYLPPRLGGNTGYWDFSDETYSKHTTISHYMDAILLDLPLYCTQRPTEESSGYYTLGTNTISFLPGLLGIQSKQVIDSIVTTSVSSVITGTTKNYIDNPFWENIFDCRIAIITDRIQTCRPINVSLADLTQTVTALEPENERWQLNSFEYEVLTDYPNDTTYRGIIFIGAAFFTGLLTTITFGGSDCYAKIYRCLEPESNIGLNSMFVFEFWIGTDGSIDFKNIHERPVGVGEPAHFDALPSAAYFPGT